MSGYRILPVVAALMAMLCSVGAGARNIPGSTLSSAPAGGEAQVGGDFSLIDHNGDPYSLHDARGKVVLMSFGYTSCPDVCPTTLLTVARVIRQLGERAGDLQPLFISVDPRRDTPEHLKDYVGYFDPSIIALTGSRERLAGVARRYRTFFRYTGDTASDHYLVDHGSSLYVIDTTGKLARIIPFGTPVGLIVSSIEQLLPEQ